VVVPNDSANGPSEYKINPEAEVTVLIYREGTVVANHSYAPGKLDAKAVEAIIATRQDFELSTLN